MSETKPHIVGLSLKVSPEMHDSVVTLRVVEEHAAEAFEAKYGFPPTGEPVWYHEEASLWTDPETGETYDLAEQWTLLVEGVQQ